jgi:hypothetical protein
MAVFGGDAVCSLVKVYRRFRGAYCLHHQGTAAFQKTVISILLSTLPFYILSMCCYFRVRDPYAPCRPCNVINCICLLGFQFAIWGRVHCKLLTKEVGVASVQWLDCPSHKGVGEVAALERRVSAISLIRSCHEITVQYQCEHNVTILVLSLCYCV